MPNRLGASGLKWRASRRVAAMAAVLTVFAAVGCEQRQPADLLITGGTIYTMRPEQFYVQAVAVSGGRIVFAGDEEKAWKYRGPDTRMLDLEGATMLPGFVDAHAHILNLGTALSQLDLVGSRSRNVIRSMVLDRLAEVGEGEWIEGRGWDQNDWEVQAFPTWQDLAGTERNPVFLKRVDGHAAWVNRTALELRGITADTPDPPGGEIIRDDSGAPTGVLVDKAVDLVYKHIPKPSREERERRIRRALDECRRYGLTGVHDTGVEREDLEIYESLEAAGELDFRVYAMLDADEDSLFAYEKMLLGPSMKDDAYLRVGAVKHYADGALGSRGALLLAPYEDRPGHSGFLRNPRESLEWWVGQAMDHGFQIAIHAIGDGGNRTVIDLYEKEIKKRRARNHRLRIEHAQVLSSEDIDRIAKLGIVAVMQPTHCTSDMYWAEARLGATRIAGAYAWRKLLDRGVVIPCGSDFPVEGVNPLWGVHAAVTRQDRSGWPEGGWYPEQRMTREEAIAGFTRDAAYAEFAEHIKGVVKKGYIADFTVFDRDVFEVPADELFITQVAYTIVGGEVVHDRLGRWGQVTEAGAER